MIGGIKVLSNEPNDDHVILKIDRRVLTAIRSALLVSEDESLDFFDREWATLYTEINGLLPTGISTTASDTFCVIRGCHPERVS